MEPLCLRHPFPSSPALARLFRRRLRATTLGFVDDHHITTQLTTMTSLLERMNITVPGASGPTRNKGRRSGASSPYVRRINRSLRLLERLS